jgi:ribonuclease J
MKLTVHRGTKEIGGNCVEIATDLARIILDVGMPLFDADGERFDEKVIRGKSVPELLEAKILPNVPGLFTEGPAPDAILLSHAHMDHTGFLRFTRPEIPVYATKGTSKMMLAGRLFARQVELPKKRFKELRAGKPRDVAGFRVTAFAVDHSVYGSVAFLIEAEGKTVLYSGDLRLHGRKPGMARDLTAALKDKTVDVLLMEGTHLGQERVPGVTEYELEEEIVNHIRPASGLVLASFSPQHIDRLVAFIRAGIRTDRTFVVDVYTAFVMHLIGNDVPIPPPKATEGIRVFYPAYFESSFKVKRLESVRKLFLADRIELSEILANPRQYLMIFRPSMLDSDFSGELPAGTRCLFSRWEGYLDQPEWQKTREKIEAAGGELMLVHTSGHIFVKDIDGFVRNVKPETLVPIHTFGAEKFGAMHEGVIVLKDGEPFQVR